MSASSFITEHERTRAAAVWPWFVRFLLAAVAVVVCHLFAWNWLRYLTSEANLQLDLLAGVQLQRLSADTVLWHGTVFHYVTACTFVDVWFGAIPLLWSMRRSLQHNLRFVVSIAVALFCFNVLRLSFSDVLFSVGIPWWLAHDVISAFAYFGVWCWIMRHQDWSESGRQRHFATPSFDNADRAAL